MECVAEKKVVVLVVAPAGDGKFKGFVAIAEEYHSKTNTDPTILCRVSPQETKGAVFEKLEAFCDTSNYVFKQYADEAVQWELKG